MANIRNIKSNFFISVWIVFFILLVAYSVYVLIVSPSLALKLKPHTDDIIPYVSFKIILGLYFVTAVFSIKYFVKNRIWFLFVVITGLIVRIILIPSTPVLEDDYYRYLWDGAVTAHGYNPYLYSPEAAMDFSNADVPDKLHELADESGDIIKNINHPHVRTIYPILSQLVFAAAYFISPWQFLAWKVILLIFDLLLLIVLIKTLNKLLLPSIFILFYWLNPVVIHEFYNSAHMDLLALLLVMLSLYFSLKSKNWYAVVLLALAVGFKLWPIVLLPLLLNNLWTDKKQLIKFVFGFTGIVLILFFPVLISNLDDSLGFIRYAGRWINNAALYQIFQWIVKQVIYFSGISVSCLSCINRWGIVIIYLIFLIFILKKYPKDNLQFFNKALLTVAVLYLISPTQFPWYYTWMIPFLAVRPKASLLIYPVFLPLYQINYLSEYLVYLQHIPIIVLFIFELKGMIWKDKFKCLIPS